MPSPVICLRDATIPNNSFQITDLFPNRSQRNPVVDPAAQGPRYLRQPENETPVVDGLTISKAVSGLTAYILVNQDDNDDILTVGNATLIANLYISRMRSGLALDTATMNTAIQGAGAGQLNLGNVTIGGGDASTTTAEILSILSGAKYTVPAGHVFDGNPGLTLPTVSFFNQNVFNAIDPSDSSFYLSVARGQLSVAKSSSTDAKGNVLSPQCVVYKADGTSL
jgi:hypothetical protein